MFSGIKKILTTLIPAPLLAMALLAYHFVFAWVAAAWFGFPARKLFVVGITGTKGKSSTAEMVNAILEEAGYRTVLASTIRFKVGTESQPNLFKMTMQGRGHLQHVLAKALQADCTHAIVELTSEGTRQFRHMGIPMNALIFTNIAPEHIESHGSYDAYKEAKLKIGKALVRSYKRPRIIVANAEDEVGKQMLTLHVERALPFSAKNAEPYKTTPKNSSLTFQGTTFTIPFPGEFSILNALAASTLASELGIDANTIGKALSHMQPILGRVERIDEGQNFAAVVDYAHTPDSLKALYSAFPGRKICVLGNTGGGRDSWKRPEMGGIADESCVEVVLTNEDPYDEEPEKIVREMASGMKRKPTIIMDRRAAIRHALEKARAGDTVLVSGKGTDPYIMGPKGTKLPWSDARVVREELKRLSGKNRTVR